MPTQKSLRRLHTNATTTLILDGKRQIKNGLEQIFPNFIPFIRVSHPYQIIEMSLYSIIFMYVFKFVTDFTFRHMRT